MFSTFPIITILCMLFNGNQVDCEKIGKCINFISYNSSNDCADIRNCKTFDKCTGDTMVEKPDHRRPTNLCFAVYRLYGTKLEPINSGCNYEAFVACDNDVGSLCILRQNKHKEKLFECCCKGEYCNRNINQTFVQKPTKNLDQKKEERRKQIQWNLIIPVTSFSILLGIFVVFLRKQFLKHHNVEKQLNNSIICKESIEMLDIVHRGHFNYVQKALYKKTHVAVKIYAKGSKSLWDSEKDIYVNCNLNHENIVNFICAELHNQNSLPEYWIVTEYAEYGSLTDYLLLSFDINFKRMLYFMTSILRGLAYLHEEHFKKPIIAHRDIKSRNILVKSDLSCCIGDFGSALAFHDQNYETGSGAKPQVGTKRYMSPEVLQGAVDFHISAVLCADNYSLSLVLWEILSRCNLYQVDPYRLPYEEVVGKDPSLHIMREIVVEKRIRPHMKDEWRNDEKLSVIVEAIENCWDEDADARLSPQCLLMRFKAFSDSTESSSTTTTCISPQDCKIALIDEKSNLTPESISSTTDEAETESSVLLKNGESC